MYSVKKLTAILLTLIIVLNLIPLTSIANDNSSQNDNSNNLRVVLTGEYYKCTADITIERNIIPADEQYYVIAIDKTSKVAYAYAYVDTTIKGLTFSETINSNASFVVVKYDQNADSLISAYDNNTNNMSGIADAPGKMIGNIQFTWNEEPENSVYHFNAKYINGNVFVDMEYHIDGTFEPENYYVSVGPYNGPYDAKNIKSNMSSSSTYGFSVPDTCLDESGHYFLAFRTATSLDDAKIRGDASVTTFYFASSNLTGQSGTETFANGRYSVTWSRVSDHHYKLSIRENGKHTVTLAAEDGINTTYYCAVLKWNINSQDYYAFAEFGDGTPQYFYMLKNLSGDNVIAYEPSIQVAEAYIITGNEYNHNYNNMVSWSDEWKKRNGEEIDNKAVAIDISTSTTATVVTIGETIPPTFTASLSFTVGGTTATLDSLGAGYYLVAKDNDNNFYFAPVTNTGIGTIVYPDNEHTLTDNKLPAIIEFKFVQYTGESVSIDNLKDLTKLTALDEYVITYPESATEGIYQFTANKPIPCTATISFVDADNRTDITPALDAGYSYSVVAFNNGTEVGSAAFTASGGLSFPEGTSINDTTTFRIQRVKDESTEIVESNGGKLGLYTFTWGEADDSHVFTITAKKDRIYTATLTFDPPDNVTLGSVSYYVLVKDGSNSYKYYAPVTSNGTTYGFGTFKDAAGNDVTTGLAGVTGFEFVKTDGTVTDINNLTSLTKIGNEGTIGEYYTLTIPGTADENYVFKITAEKQSNQYFMKYTNTDGSITLADNAPHYYLLATVGGEAAFYADLPTATSTNPIEFTNAAGSPASTLPNVVLSLKQIAEEATSLSDVAGAGNATMILDSTEKKYVISSWDTAHSKALTHEYDITVNEILAENCVVIDFKDGDDPDTSAILSGNYYLVIKIENDYYYSPITITGSSAVLNNFTKVDGEATATTIDTINQNDIEYLSIIKDKNPTHTLSIRERINDRIIYYYDKTQTLEETELQQNKKIEQYYIYQALNTKGSDNNFHITLKKREGYQAILQFKDSAIQNSVTPGEDPAPAINAYSWAVAELYEGSDDAPVFKGYAVQPISTSSSSSVAVFDEFKLVQPSGDSYQDSGSISYIDAKDNNYYIRRVSIGHSSQSNEPDGYNNVKNLDYSDYDGYTFVSNRRDNYVNEQNKGDPRTATSSTITIRVADPTDYCVMLDCGEEPLTLPPDYSLYAKVTVKHTEESGTRYAVVKLDTTIDGGKIYKATVEEWYDAQGNIDPDEKVTNHEKEVSVELYAVPSGTSIAKPSDLGDTLPISINDYIQTHKVVSYPDIYKDKTNANDNSDTNRIIDEDPGTKTTITDVIYLEKNDDHFTLYSLEGLLNGGYNVVTLCEGSYKDDEFGENVGPGDAFIGVHQMGAVLIHGDLDITSNVTGLADSTDAINPSVVGGLIDNPTASASQSAPFIHQRPAEYEQMLAKYAGIIVNAYLGSSNNVAGYYVNGQYHHARTDRDFGFNRAGATIVSDDFVDWKRLRETIQNASDALLGIAQEEHLTPVQKDTSGEGENNGNNESNKDYVVDVAPGSNVIIDFDPSGGKTLTVNIKSDDELYVVGEDGKKRPKEDIPGTVINFTSSTDAIVPKLTLNGVEPSTDETGKGISIVYNFPNATGTVAFTSGSEFGHVVAPKALVKFTGGNYSGTLIGNNAYIGSDAEGHLYPYKGGDLVGVYGEIDFGKQLNNADPTTQKFKFKLDQFISTASASDYVSSGEEVFWENKQEVKNSGASINFDDIPFFAIGDYYFRIYEDTSVERTGLEYDETKYLLKVHVSSTMEGNKSILFIDNVETKLYEITDEDQLLSIDDSGSEVTAAINEENALTPASAISIIHDSQSTTNNIDKIDTNTLFYNTTNEFDITVSLSGTKTLEGKQLDENDFLFEVYDENDNKITSGRNNAQGTITFGDIGYKSETVFPADDNTSTEKIFTYTVNEVMPAAANEDNQYTVNGIRYDPTPKTITVKVSRVYDENTGMWGGVIRQRWFRTSIHSPLATHLLELWKLARLLRIRAR